MTRIKRRHQHAIFLRRTQLFPCHTQLFTHTLLHPLPFEKDLVSLKQNIYLSPFLHFCSVSCSNSFNSQLSVPLENNLLVCGGSRITNFGILGMQKVVNGKTPVLPEGSEESRYI